MKKWQQMFAPEPPDDALALLRSELGRNPDAAAALEAFLFAQWLCLQSRARLELNPEMKRVYLAAADTLADLAGTVFQPERARTTNGVLHL